MKTAKGDGLRKVPVPFQIMSPLKKESHPSAAGGFFYNNTTSFHYNKYYIGISTSHTETDWQKTANNNIKRCCNKKNYTKSTSSKVTAKGLQHFKDYKFNRTAGQKLHHYKELQKYFKVSLFKEQQLLHCVMFTTPCLLSQGFIPEWTPPRVMVHAPIATEHLAEVSAGIPAGKIVCFDKFGAHIPPPRLLNHSLLFA